MLKITFSQKRFFVSLDELALFMEPDIKYSMIAWASAGAGGKTDICPRLENGIINQIFLEKPELGIFIPIN